MSNLTYNYIKMGKKCQLVQSLSLTLFWGSSCSRAAGCHLKSPQRAGWCAGCTAGLSLQYPWGCWAEDKGVCPAASHPPVTVGSQMETYWPPLDLWPKQMKMVWDYGKVFFFFFTVHMKAFAKKQQQSHLKPPVRSDYRTGHPDRDQPAVHDRHLWPQQPHRRTSADSGADAVC